MALKVWLNLADGKLVRSAKNNRKPVETNVSTGFLRTGTCPPKSRLPGSLIAAPAFPGRKREKAGRGIRGCQ